MWRSHFLILAMLGLALCAIPPFHCPDGITCHQSGQEIEASSFEFLEKLSPKNYRAILKLTISNASINKVDPKLKYLKNLEYLDLSSNNVQLLSLPSLVHLKTLKLSKNSLKFVNMTALPPNIVELDLSNNLLTQIPKDWQSLRHLKVLHIHKNPIECSCYSVLSYKRVVQKNIQVPGTLHCHSPSNYIGKDIASINCSLDDIMQYDEGYEGSGAVDVEENLTDEKANVAFIQETEDEEVNLDNNTIIDEKITGDDELLEQNEPIMEAKSMEENIEQEGSGDEGSGFGFQLPESGVLGCIENCSTPGPVGQDDEEYASALPGPIDQLGILLDDINLFKDPKPNTTTPTTTTTTAASTTAKQLIVKEPKILKEHTNTQQSSDKKEDVEIIANTTDTSELQRASTAPENSTAVYVVVGIIICLAVLFAVCFIKRSRAKRNHNNRRQIPPLEEEMKSINKPLIGEVNEKPAKGAATVPENTPLLNGQNGKPRSDSPKLKSYVPLAHPELLNNDDDDKPAQTNGVNSPPQLDDNEAYEDVEIRPKMQQPELLTPERQRVTVRESEIPEPIPKTPLLVHRQKNSDGEFVTTLVP